MLIFPIWNPGEHFFFNLIITSLCFFLPQIIIRPKCGRMVTYKSSDPVGVKPFSDPDIQRCVLLNVFDNTPSQDEINHIDASLLLKKIDQQRVKVNSNDRKKVLKTLKEQGVEVTMTSKDLRGKERFVADGLASDEECETLIELANVSKNFSIYCFSD